jgi:hypothetical protein
MPIEKTFIISKIERIKESLKKIRSKPNGLIIYPNNFELQNTVI